MAELKKYVIVLVYPYNLRTEVVEREGVNENDAKIFLDLLYPGWEIQSIKEVKR